MFSAPMTELAIDCGRDLEQADLVTRFRKRITHGFSNLMQSVKK